MSKQKQNFQHRWVAVTSHIQYNTIANAKAEKLVLGFVKLAPSNIYLKLSWTEIQKFHLFYS